jgi:hypothetical protein
MARAEVPAREPSEQLGTSHVVFSRELDLGGSYAGFGRCSHELEVTESLKAINMRGRGGEARPKMSPKPRGFAARLSSGVRRHAVIYDIPLMVQKHRACVSEMADHFKTFFLETDYSKPLPRKVRVQSVRSRDDLAKILAGPGFYCIASTIPTDENKCTLRLGSPLAPVIYRGHSYSVRERIESHLFNEPYVQRDSGRRFKVCLKLRGKNIDIDRGAEARHSWLVATHSMPNSTLFVREAAERGFDLAFCRPIGSDNE